LFALTFKFVPNTDIASKDLWTGAIVTAFLFTVGKSLIGLYLDKAGVGSAYGAAGLLIVVTVLLLNDFLFRRRTHSRPRPSSAPNKNRVSAQVTIAPAITNILCNFNC
jgi:hypothetical protein